MVFKICPFVLFLLLIIPLSAFSQNNSPGFDYESQAKKKRPITGTPDLSTPGSPKTRPAVYGVSCSGSLAPTRMPKKKRINPSFPVSRPMQSRKFRANGIPSPIWVTPPSGSGCWAKKMITDPVFGDIVLFIKRHAPFPIPLAELPEFQVVLISHSHYDHLDQDSIRRLGPDRST